MINGKTLIRMANDHNKAANSFRFFSQNIRPSDIRKKIKKYVWPNSNVFFIAAIDKSMAIQ